MQTDELDFHLPPELIAQVPAEDRAGSRLLRYRKEGRSISHHGFEQLPALLRRGDLLVFNDTKVLPARFVVRKQSGGRIEGLFLEQVSERRWSVLLRGLEGYRGVLRFEGEENLSAICTAERGGGEYEIEIDRAEPAEAILARIGRMPLPPYIKRAKDGDERDAEDRLRYQTVYARWPGSVAAPTAGLHFTPGVLAALERAGIGRAFVTLHVGLGTFKPVVAGTLEEHVMHGEKYEISDRTAELLNAAAKDGRRIVAVGTTSARVLESHPMDAPWKAVSGQTAIFIYPPYSWRHVGGLITNFHLPRSTLIGLVAAFVGLEEQRRVYAAAIAERYRFFSFGDAMLAE